MSEPGPGEAADLVIVNAETARFECTYGRGCDGLCCRNGRPPVTKAEAERIDANIARILPRLRPEARNLVEKQGYLSRRGLPEQPMLRVISGWCVFFHEGCVLHKLGAEEGEKHRYKPAPCALFPLARDHRDRWHVRQWGHNREAWDLFCLDPDNTDTLAVVSLQEEIALARDLSLNEASRNDGGSGRIAIGRRRSALQGKLGHGFDQGRHRALRPARCL